MAGSERTRTILSEIPLSSLTYSTNARNNSPSAATLMACSSIEKSRYKSSLGERGETRGFIIGVGVRGIIGVGVRDIIGVGVRGIIGVGVRGIIIIGVRVRDIVENEMKSSFDCVGALVAGLSGEGHGGVFGGGVVGVGGEADENGQERVVQLIVKLNVLDLQLHLLLVCLGARVLELHAPQ